MIETDMDDGDLEGQEVAEVLVKSADQNVQVTISETEVETKCPEKFDLDAKSNASRDSRGSKSKERSGSSLSIRSARDPIPSSGGGRLKQLSTKEKLELHEEMILSDQRSATLLDFKVLRQTSKTPDPAPAQRRLSGTIEKVKKSSLKQTTEQAHTSDVSHVAAAAGSGVSRVSLQCHLGLSQPSQVRRSSRLALKPVMPSPENKGVSFIAGIHEENELYRCAHTHKCFLQCLNMLTFECINIESQLITQFLLFFLQQVR